MKEIIPAIFMLLSVVQTTLGTPQAGTLLRFNGTNHYVYGFALRPDMQETFQRNRDKLTVISSANWKGYYVDLEIRGKQLYLTSLDIDRGDGWFWRGPSVRKMFGTTVPTGGIFADWFTGELKEPVGEPLIFYTTITEVVRAFTFDKGILTAIEMRKSDYAKELEEKEQSSRSNHVLRVSAATSGNAATPQIHVVRQGDTLFGIARRYGVSVKEIIQANDMMNPDVITVGQAVVIPQETRTMQNKPSATP